MSLLHYLLAKKHHQYRHRVDWNLAEEYSARGLSPAERMADRFVRVCREEMPVLLPKETICFLRTVENLPDIFTGAEWEEIKSKHFIHELGFLSNLSPNYEEVIATGLLEQRKSAGPLSRRCIDALLELTDRYRLEARKRGDTELAQVLEQVPRHGARSFREALQSFRILHYGLWLEGNYHNTAGRFDQYMYPYLKADMEKGLYTEETALSLLEDFFLSFNKDSDLYVGVQQGDNGQSMVLGGVDRKGNQGFNLLSRLCLRASGELKLIDPKINLRVDKNTPAEIYELGTELTKAGLGFPQYSNDDVVIPGLLRLGYEPEDAADYAIAACWEFIIPKVGADVANIGALSFPKVVDEAFRGYLKECDTFDQFMMRVKKALIDQANAICDSIKDLWFVPSPFMNVMMGCDVSQGAKYNNFGIHGTGIATAADSLEAVRRYVYEEKSISKEEYLEAVESDFAKHEELLPKLRYETAKLGQDNEGVDALGVQLLTWFSQALEGKTNCRGGRFRAGTGSAMFYLWHAAELGASPDGRRKGEAFGTNFSVSLFAKIPGPLSVVRSFSKFPFTLAINGGPLTLEFHSRLFDSPESVGKVARLVKTYMDLGGHQLQLNAVNAQKMKDAQLHPENYQQLVVRIWGWSAYFVELDKAFQDHVIARQEYSV